LASNLPTNLKQTNFAQQLEGSSDTDIPVAKPTIEKSTSAIENEAPNSVPAGFKAIPKVYESGPKTAFDWNALGNSYAGRQDYEKAIFAYKKSIELDPGFGQAYCNMGSVLYQTGKYESAVLILKKSLDYMVSPEEKSLSWNRLGDVYRRLRDYGNAMAAYQKAGQSNFETNPVLNRARISLMDHVAVG
jgi:tetratricopeptide (TPR) repeat protein